MTAGDVVNAVKEQNIQVAAGIVGGPPLPTESRAFQYTMKCAGPAYRPCRNSPTSSSRSANDGRITRLKDVGRVELGAADYSTTD